MKVEILAAGKIKKGALLTLWEEYKKRMPRGWTVDLQEIDSKTREADDKKFQSLIKPNAFVVVLDERGKSMTSWDFATKLQKVTVEGASCIQIFIGNAYGFTDDFRAKANLLLSYGQQTFPHKLVRIMAIEQIYRASCILSGHPYHHEG